MDDAFWSGLVNVGTAAIVSLGIAFFEPAKNVRAILFIIVCLTALMNFFYQRTSTQALRAELSDLRANRWAPLSDDEGKRLVMLLSNISPPKKTINILCGLSGCSDLSESIRVKAKQAGWNIVISSPMFGAKEGIELFYFDQDDLNLAKALEAATSKRLLIDSTKFERDMDQINLAIGYKP